MDRDKLQTFTEIIENFDTDYYKEKIEVKQKEIDNIRMDLPRYEGIHASPGKVVPRSQKEKEIEKLRRAIKDIKEQARELGKVIHELKSSLHQLERLAEQDVLLDAIQRLLRNRRFDEFGKTDIYKENQKKYSKLYSKSDKKIDKPKHKISKEMYKLIKTNKRLYAYKGSKSIERALEDNNIYLNQADKYTPGNRVFHDTEDKYKSYLDYSGLKPLGVDTDRIDYASNAIKGEINRESLTWNGKEAFDKFENIEIAKKTRMDIKGGYSKLNELKEKYTEILELSRETWYLDEVLSSFRNTDIVKTDFYIGLKDMLRDQERELRELISSADKLYEKTGLQNKINSRKELEDLYIRVSALKQRIEDFRKQGYDREADLLEKDYYNLRYEMIKILRDNPDLDQPEYKINIKDVIEKEKQLLEPEIKREEAVVEKSHSKDPVVPTSSNVDEIPTYIETPEEKIFVEKTPKQEKTVTAEKLELDSNLQIHRSMHYQDYMREKVKNSELGKIPFSEYLEKVAPHLKELIAVEKERERLAQTIYKQYIQYYASLENKKDAIDFYSYAKQIYSIDNIDIPVEKEEEYKGMMKR